MTKIWSITWCIIASLYHQSRGFTLSAPSRPLAFGRIQSQSHSSTVLNVWFFGGSPDESTAWEDEDSCELVAVRIERPSSNSRRIFGDITVPTNIDDVWSILTDYDRLSIHVPNLVESKITQRLSGGEQGDGQFRCRLYQRGAQKIVGFEFGASVTMNMKEIANDLTVSNALPPVDNGRVVDGGNERYGKERIIEFKCVESLFFKGFDGEWKISERVGAEGKPECLLSYVVDVSPNGPVPVAALEWRIREDVPTNLRAVKKAAVELGANGVQAARTPYNRFQRASSSLPSLPSRVALSSERTQYIPVTGTTVKASPPPPPPQALTTRNAMKKKSASQDKKSIRKINKVKVQWERWEESETMAAYLDEI